MSGRRSNKQRMRGPSASLSGVNGATEMEHLRQSEVDSKAKIKAVSYGTIILVKGH